MASIRLQISIHPHATWNGRRSPPLSTCAPRSVHRLQRQLAGIAKHLEQHPNDSMSRQRVATIRALLDGSPASKRAAA